MLQLGDDAPSWRASGTRMNVLTVTQLSRYLREALENDPVLGDIWVSGELSNLSRSAVGHLYFTLKDAGGQLRCVMFKDYVTPACAAAVDGGAVVVHGRFSFYELRGDLQLKVDFLKPQGDGPLNLEFERLKAKLEAEGLFEQSRKRRPPQFPRRIAVVTSPQGAVLHDILTIVQRRYPLVEILLAPVAVQGDGAAGSIVAAFHKLQQREDVDLVILARGGGSMEELWPFNEEATARAVYASRAPVISAVGHETDTTIVDFVADVRAPTPSAAAELAVPNHADLLADIERSARVMRSALDRQITAGRAQVARVSMRRPDLDRERLNLDYLTRRGLTSLRAALAAHKAGLERCTAVISSLDPAMTLERGYAIVYHGGTVVTSAADVTSGDPLAIRVKDGSFDAVAGSGKTSRPRPAKAPAEDQLSLL